jgi:hypothetical protein
VGLNSLNSLNLTNGYPNNNNNNNNNKVKSKPLELFELAGKKNQSKVGGRFKKILGLGAISYEKAFSSSIVVVPRSLLLHTLKNFSNIGNFLASEVSVGDVLTPGNSKKRLFWTSLKGLFINPISTMYFCE